MFIIYVCLTDCDPIEVANSDYSDELSVTGTFGDMIQITCDPGFSGGGNTTCSAAGFFDVLSCLNDPCDPITVTHSDYASINVTGVTYDTVTVTCDSGYKGGGTVMCQPNGTFSEVTCLPEACSATEVANSNYSATGSITGVTGDTINVGCDVGYSGGGVTLCQHDNSFQILTCTPNDCEATEVANSNKASTGSITGVTGQSVAVTCLTGYTGKGLSTVTCGTDGYFDIDFECIGNASTYI